MRQREKDPMNGQVVVCAVLLYALCGQMAVAEERRSVDDPKSRSCKVVLSRSEALAQAESAIRSGDIEPWNDEVDPSLRSQIERYVRIHADEDVTAMLELLQESQAAGLEVDFDEEERLFQLEFRRTDILCARPIAYSHIEKNRIYVFIRVCVNLWSTCREDLITTEWKRVDGQWVLGPGWGEILM